ncbi:MAG: DUF2029 domain-containing protein [Acidobacteriota bacterium]|nr:DUF2029 domain-containing protein [Acidobacteriota bacterium]
MAGRPADRDADRASEAARTVTIATPWRTAAIALLLAAVNVGVGLAIATETERTFDFIQVMAWSAEWLRGENPYAPPLSLADYPPSSLVLFAPLAAMPLHVALGAWVAVNAVLAAVIAWLAARLVITGTAAMTLACAVLALPPFRTLNQFSIAAFAPALAGVWLAPRHPITAGIAIGLSLIKPHIGGPALLWAIVSRRWTTLAAALGTQAALGAFYLARTAAPLNVPSEYLQAIARTQNRADLIAGETNLQPLLSGVPLTPVALQVLSASLLAVGLVVIWRKRESDFDLRFFGAACLLSLLSFRHLGYNLLLAIPVLVWALSHDHRVVRVTGAAAFLVLVASPPTLWRYVIEPLLGGTMGGAIPDHAYRVVLIALFVLLMAAPARQRA